MAVARPSWTQRPSSLRQLRMDLNLKLPDAAKLVGCTPQHLARIERGTSIPREGTLQSLAAAYGKRPSEIEDAIRRDLISADAEVA